MFASLFLPRCLTLTFIFLLLVFGPTSFSAKDLDFTECSKPFNCGNLKGLSYPFWSTTANRSQACGQDGFQLRCQEAQLPVLSTGRIDFLVLDVNLSEKLITIARKDFWNTTCPGNLSSTTLNETYFSYSDQSGLRNISFFYNCNSSIINPTQIPSKFSCPGYGADAFAFYATDALLKEYREPDLSQCGSNIQVPVPAMSLDGINVTGGVTEVERALRKGFNVSYKTQELCLPCMSSGGKCGTNVTGSGFACYCERDHHSPFTCDQDQANSSSVKWKVIIGVASGGITMLIICTIIRSLQGKEPLILWSCRQICKNKETKNQDLEAAMKNYGAVAPKRYKFSDVKRMTNSFKDRLGQGGYGDVFKGKLLDGHLVAVKVLNTTKGTGEEFINEVVSISRTSHVNIVTLLGFCIEGSRRALIYEFMPNGSLEKFIYGRKKLKVVEHLGWEKLYQIAIGVARGLEYLHCGCNTRIVHFDIKPTNVLLDEDFCPKISDFGLAKLCTRKESVVSMLHARGTIGYIAPEVFSRSFGGVSYKSDVYSFGMMILEMVGEREGGDIEGEEDINGETTGTYFPQWAYKQFELDNNFELPGVVDREDIEIVKKMTLVGLWCIQTNPTDRPSISKVIEMLEGSTEAVKIPPKPFLFSPQKSPPSFSMNTEEIFCVSR